VDVIKKTNRNFMLCYENGFKSVRVSTVYGYTVNVHTERDSVRDLIVVQTEAQRRLTH